MWLINTTSLELHEFIFEKAPVYDILSHRWGTPDEEMTFKAFRKQRRTETIGYKKVADFCELSRTGGTAWAWVDTCCIDQKSSAELSEAINAMWSYYENAKTCYAYLNDCRTDVNDWHRSAWWTRGWTLQEMLAPRQVLFYDQDWNMIGSIKTLAEKIADITKIPQAILLGAASTGSCCIAEMMSWASMRETTRIEDRAYSLLGLFHINMPLLYGEGNRAFQRLQIHLIEKYSDLSILAWRSEEALHSNKSPSSRSSRGDTVKPADAVSAGSVLASSPSSFRLCHDMESVKITSEVWEMTQQIATAKTEQQYPIVPNLPAYTPPRVTGWGLELRANVIEMIFADKKRKTQAQAAVPDQLLAINLTRWTPTGTHIFRRWLILSAAGPSTINRRVDIVDIPDPAMIFGGPDMCSTSRNKMLYLHYDADMDDML